MRNILTSTKLILGVIFMSLCLSISNAQSVSKALTSMESSVNNKKNNWTLNEKDVKEKFGKYDWIADKKTVHISIEEADSPEAAIALLKQTMLKITAPAKSKLIGYGDEAYLYKMDRTERSMILIRQSNLFILVSSSHLAHAQEFAKDICEIVKNQKTQK